MKNMKTFAVLIVGGLAVGGFVIPQTHNGRVWSHRAMPHHLHPPAAEAHLAEAFPTFAAFDANRDGKLDETEKEALGKAITSGTLQLPAHTPPHGAKPDVAMMVNHIGEMYGQIAQYDANQDGMLDETE